MWWKGYITLFAVESLSHILFHGCKILSYRLFKFGLKINKKSVKACTHCSFFP